MLSQIVDGNDFYTTIVDMGEEIHFLTAPQVDLFASIAPQRNTNTTDGIHWFKGAMTFDSVNQQDELVGEYFTRQTNPKPKYLLAGVMPENTTPKMATVYAVECNEFVDVVSHYEESEEPNADGVFEKIPVYLAKDVATYCVEVMQRVDEEVPGAFAKTKTNIILPAKVTISSQNIIMKNSFIFDESLNKNVYKKIPYRVESVDTSRMSVLPNGEFAGIIKCMLTEDRNNA